MKNNYGFNHSETDFFKRFKSPHDIQLFLNSLKYNPKYNTSSPRYVILNKTANCFEGALFAAAALRMMGYKPLIVDLIAVNDDDHVIAMFKKNNCYGAVAKSNTTLLRYREPVYKTLRELVMSYFDFYFNTNGEKSLISYSNPIDLSKYDKFEWMTTKKDLGFIGDNLFKVYHHTLLTKDQRKGLNHADPELVNACFIGSDKKGLFKPAKKKKKL